MKRFGKSQLGFTLTEVIVTIGLSMTLIGLVSFLMYQKFSQLALGTRFSNVQTEASQFFDLLSRDANYTVNLHSVLNTSLNQTQSPDGRGYIREFHYNKRADSSAAVEVLAYYLVETQSASGTVSNLRSQLQPRALLFIPPTRDSPGELILTTGSGGDITSDTDGIRMKGIIELHLIPVSRYQNLQAHSASITVQVKVPMQANQKISWCPLLNSTDPDCRLGEEEELFRVDSFGQQLSFYNNRRESTLMGSEFPLGFYLFR